MQKFALFARDMNTSHFERTNEADAIGDDICCGNIVRCQGARLTQHVGERHRTSPQLGEDMVRNAQTGRKCRLRTHLDWHDIISAASRSAAAAALLSRRERRRRTAATAARAAATSSLHWRR
jgi:hypothetical protein